MKKFTIVDKQEAHKILMGNQDLTQEDKDTLSSSPVFSVLVSLFEKYYGLKLLSTYDADMNYDHKGIYKNRLINQFNPDDYVSMDSDNDRYAEYYKNWKKSKKTKHTSFSIKKKEVEPDYTSTKKAKYQLWVESSYARSIIDNIKGFGLKATRRGSWPDGGVGIEMKGNEGDIHKWFRDNPFDGLDFEECDLQFI